MEVWQNIIIMVRNRCLGSTKSLTQNVNVDCVLRLTCTARALEESYFVGAEADHFRNSTSSDPENDS